MKIPDLLNICGKTYTISQKVAEDGFGGSGDSEKQEIEVCKGRHSDESVFETLLHEIMEMVACERGLHYVNNRSDISISMTHKEFDVFSADVAAGIFKMVAPTVEDILKQADREGKPDKMEWVSDCIMNKVTTCCGAEIDESQVIQDGPHKGHGPRFCSKCGKLDFMV